MGTKKGIGGQKKKNEKWEKEKEQENKDEENRNKGKEKEKPKPRRIAKKARKKEKEEDKDKACRLYKEAEDKYKKFSEKLKSKKPSQQNLKILETAVSLYKQAAYLGHKQAQERLIWLRDNFDHIYQNAVVNLNSNAMKGYIQAVYNEGGFGNTDSEPSSSTSSTNESSSDGEKGVSDNEHKKSPFNKFTNRAEERYKELNGLDAKQKKQKNIIKPKKLQNMRLSNLVVMNLDLLKTPARVEWGGNYQDPTQANAKELFGPLFEMPATEDYEHGVLAIDPSSTGSDETGYCVAKRYKDYYFILDVGGFAGGYQKDRKARRGHTNKILDKLVEIANQNNVTTILIESNADPSFAPRIKTRLIEKGIGYIKVDVIPQSGNKQERIVRILNPLLKAHQIIIAQTALKSDFKSGPQKDGLHYKFFYQLMAIESTSKPTTTGFFQSNPTHDDRVDAVAIAIEYLQNKRSISTEIWKLENGIKDKIENFKDKEPTFNQLLNLVQTKYQLTDLYQELGTSLGRQRAFSLYQEIQEKDIYMMRSLVKNHQKNTRTERLVLESLQKELKEEEIKYKYKLAELYQELATPEDQVKAFNLYEEILEAIEEKKQELKSNRSLKKEKAEFEKSSLYTDIYIKTIYRLAKLYQRGIKKGVDFLILRNEEQAIEYYQKTKEKYILANYEWAQLLQKGYQGEQEQVKKSAKKASIIYKNALELYEKAPNKDYATAIYQLAKMYETGVKEIDDETGELLFELNQAITESLELYKKAAKAGHTKAQVKLGNLYMQQEKFQVEENPSYRRAIKWYLKAAEQNNKIAQYNLGQIFQNGWGIDRKNEAVAFKWYTVAAERGHIEAQYKLGRLYNNNQEGKPAIKWYKRAAKQGHAYAQFELGILEIDPFEKQKWYEKAMAQDKGGVLGSLIQTGLTIQDEGEQAKFFNNLIALMNREQKS